MDAKIIFGICTVVYLWTCLILSAAMQLYDRVLTYWIDEYIEIGNENGVSRKKVWFIIIMMQYAIMMLMPIIVIHDYVWLGNKHT